jgi:hypothetical protein
MKNAFVPATFAFILLGCHSQPKSDAHIPESKSNQRVAELEKQVAAPKAQQRQDTGEEPYFSVVGSEHVLYLGAVQKEAIRAYNPDFQIRKEADYISAAVKDYPFSDHQTPFAIIGDFNGDGKKDVVLQGHDKTNDLLVAVLSSNQDPQIIEIRRSDLTDPASNWIVVGRDDTEYGLWIYLTFVPNGNVYSYSSLEERTLQVSNDAFELDYYEKAAEVYYLKGDKFQTFATAPLPLE